jgi:hypothetical protein
MTTKPELLPCPFCGSLDVCVVYRGVSPVAVECKPCGAHGPNAGFLVPGWNLRSPSIPAADEQLREHRADCMSNGTAEGCDCYKLDEEEAYKVQSALRSSVTHVSKESKKIYLSGLEGTRAIIETQDKVDVKEYERVVLALIDLYQCRSSVTGKDARWEKERNWIIVRLDEKLNKLRAVGEDRSDRDKGYFAALKWLYELMTVKVVALEATNPPEGK